jgi:hypothetical protein
LGKYDQPCTNLGDKTQPKPMAAHQTLENSDKLITDFSELEKYISLNPQMVHKKESKSA